MRSPREFLDVRALTVAAGVLYLIIAAYALATGDAAANSLTDLAFSLVMVGFGVLLRVRNPDEMGLRVAGGLFVLTGLSQGYLLLADDAPYGGGAVSLLALAAFSLYLFEMFVRPRLG
ncbi:hypothetical protein G9464_07735 [Halostella sp. JP-L12]|uniref:hypothetical protein n=1 Tax=Halostella TaxID=1843185 RepID=UPI000EF768B8|nr:MULTISPECIES: hypothetical protein [Halostella]NHN47484.1 hypothetical protein [Halostella sp. JP-L12]